MSVTLTEREAIAKMMSYIEGERERLWGDYIRLLDRLRVLDDIDRPTSSYPKLNLSELSHTPQASAWEPIPVKDETPAPTVEEAVQVEEEPQYDPIIELKKQDEFLQDTVLEEEEQDIGFNYFLKQAEEEEKKSKFTKEIEELKDKDAKNNPLKPSSTRDVKLVAQYVRAILKEAGVPLKTAELIKRMEEANIDTSSPYVLLSQVRNYDSKIEKASFGYYQYKW